MPVLAHSSDSCFVQPWPLVGNISKQVNRGAPVGHMGALAQRHAPFCTPGKLLEG